MTTEQTRRQIQKRRRRIHKGSSPNEQIILLAVEPHPNADRLTLATVDCGAGQPKTVVTGAPNIKVGDRGQTVIVALAGSVLFDGHAEARSGGKKGGARAARKRRDGH